MAALVTVYLSVIRVPKRPVINTPVVSISVHDGEELLPRALDKPVTVQFRLLETEERTKPICVFWNHSILVSGTGGWSARGCEVVFRNESHVSCQCNHMTSFAVLMDVSRREVGPTGVAPSGGWEPSRGAGCSGTALGENPDTRPSEW